jgi:hypothetical protein
MSQKETSQQRERRELTALMWFFWAGILMATVGELSLIFLSGEGAHPGSESLSNATILISAFVVLLWTGIGVIHKTRFGGGGMPTAIFCWMLAKGSAVLGMVTFFLEPNWIFTGAIMGGFLLLMGLLQPTSFLPEKP